MPFLFALLIALLLPAWVSAKQPTKRPTDERRGEILFQQNCWQCHGTRGEGSGPLAEAFGGPLAPIGKRFGKGDYNDQIKVILQGRGDMPGFDQVMDRADARRVLIWLEQARITKSSPKRKAKRKGKSSRRSRPGRRQPVKPVQPEVKDDNEGGGDNEAGGGE